MQDLIDEGHAAIQLVNQLHDAVVEDEDLSDKQKSIITEKLAVSFEQQLVRLWRTVGAQINFSYSLCRKWINVWRMVQMNTCS